MKQNSKKSKIHILFLRVFTWWYYATFSTWLFTLWRGELVGEDIFGNQYYRHKRKDRRWVIYRGLAEPSLVPAQFHAWLHYTTNEIPSEKPHKFPKWQKNHLPNLTGTPLAYRPSGSLTFDSIKRQKSGADYQPWRPDEE